MKVRNRTDFALLVGVDWADRKHDLCERHPTTGAATYQTISSKPEGIQEWALALKKRFPNQPIAVACELKKGPLIYALSQYSHIVIFPLNPASVAKYRKAFASSGAKDDPSDAYLQSEFLFLHMSKLRALEPESPTVRKLGQFVEIRRRLVQDKIRLTNRIVAALKNYYPQVLEWFDERDTRLFCDFMTRWPTLEAAKKAKKSTLKQFFTRRGSRYNTVNDRRIDAIQSALALTQDDGVIEPNQWLVLTQVAQLRLMIEAIDQVEQKINATYRTMRDFSIFDSFPGAGPRMGPRLLVAFGENKQRYDGCEELQKYSGIAPVLERSGKQSWVHWRYCCPTFLRQTFVEWAGLSIRYSFWANAYYEQQKAKGKLHQTIIRALAFKWIRIMYRCWKEGVPYDETKYLNALKKRHAPLLKFAVTE